MITAGWGPLHFSRYSIRVTDCRVELWPPIGPSHLVRNSASSGWARVWHWPWIPTIVRPHTWPGRTLTRIIGRTHFTSRSRSIGGLYGRRTSSRSRPPQTLPLPHRKMARSDFFTSSTWGLAAHVGTHTFRALCTVYRH